MCDNCHPDICHPLFCDICHPLFSDNCHPDICHPPKFIFNFFKLFSNSNIKLEVVMDGKKSVTCWARDGRYKGEKILVEEPFICDNSIQCDDGADETGCNEEYVRKKIFIIKDNYRCNSVYLNFTRSDGTHPRQAMYHLPLSLLPPPNLFLLPPLI